MGEFHVPPGTGGRSRFGLFEFDMDALELRREGRVVPLRPQPARLLATLLARPGTLVTRAELRQALWGASTFVDFDQGVNHAVRDLRAALGDAAESPRFVQTLPRRGYRFIAAVEIDGRAAARLVTRPRGPWLRMLARMLALVEWVENRLRRRLDASGPDRDGR